MSVKYDFTYHHVEDTSEHHRHGVIDTECVSCTPPDIDEDCCAPDGDTWHEVMLAYFRAIEPHSCADKPDGMCECDGFEIFGNFQVLSMSKAY